MIGWIVFGVVVIIMLALDLGVFHRNAHEIKVKEAMIWSVVWIGLAMLFNVGLLFSMGKEQALVFFTGYVLEKSLSVDNIFVFLLIFSYFQVPQKFQHKVLFWGIVGALVMRAIFIAAGVAILERFHWVIYVFGVMLVLTGIKLFFEKDKEINPDKNPAIRLFKRFMPITNECSQGNFFTRINGKLTATTLFVVLIVVETTDLVFAVDSIPAILAITRDPFLIYTSNVFAILGLRALYFAIAGLMKLFHFLHYGLAAILVFIGIKMFVSHFIHIPTWLALGFIGAVLAFSVGASVLFPQEEKHA